MPANKRAQSTLEYAAITIFTIFSILIMGPYVVKGINAYFKTVETSVKDSFEENINQAPFSVVASEDGVACVCDGNFTPTSLCGNGVDCAYDQRIWKQICSPPGCNPTPYLCVPDNPFDPFCCEGQWRDTGLCDADADHGTYGGVPTLTGDCNPGDMQQERVCNGGILYNCSATRVPASPYPPNFCDARCNGRRPNNVDSQWCAGDTTGFMGTINVTFVETGNCTIAQLCEIECLYPYVVLGPPPGVGCICPEIITYLAGIKLIENPSDPTLISWGLLANTTGAVVTGNIINGFDEDLNSSFGVESTPTGGPIPPFYFGNTTHTGTILREPIVIFSATITFDLLNSSVQAPFQIMEVSPDGINYEGVWFNTVNTAKQTVTVNGIWNQIKFIRFRQMATGTNPAPGQFFARIYEVVINGLYVDPATLCNCPAGKDWVGMIGNNPGDCPIGYHEDAAVPCDATNGTIYNIP